MQVQSQYLRSQRTAGGTPTELVFEVNGDTGWRERARVGCSNTGAGSGAEGGQAGREDADSVLWGAEDRLGDV